MHLFFQKCDVSPAEINKLRWWLTIEKFIFENVTSLPGCFVSVSEASLDQLIDLKLFWRGLNGRPDSLLPPPPPPAGSIKDIGIPHHAPAAFLGHGQRMPSDGQGIICRLGRHPKLGTTRFITRRYMYMTKWPRLMQSAARAWDLKVRIPLSCTRSVWAVVPRLSNL